MVLGALALSYVQQLVANNQPLPNKVYLLSPMLDATLTNPEITEDLSKRPFRQQGWLTTYIQCMDARRSTS